MKNLFLLCLLFCCSIFNLFAQTSNWMFTGPSDFPTNISGQIHGIGRVSQIKFDPNNNSTIYACSASGGLWKSINDGNSWLQLGTDVLPAMAISSVCIDYTNSNIIYISSGDANYYNNDFGIWKTVDGGANWAQMNTGIGNLMAVEILMDSTDHLTLLAATKNGIWKTINGGLLWTTKLVGNPFRDMKWKAGLGSSIVFASTNNKFFRSSDRGETWIEITSGLAGLLNQTTAIAVSNNNPDIVYLATSKDEGTIFKSVDSGLNFVMQYHNPLWSLTGYDSTGGGQGSYNFCFEANPDNVNQLFLGSHNIMRSNDGGVSWQKLTNWWQTVHTDMHDYIFQPGNSNNLFQANDGGVWLTTNAGVDWTPKSDGLGATENYHAAVSPLYPGLISTGTQDNGELVFIDGKWKTNRGGDWTTKMQMDYSMQKFVYYFDDLERRALPSGGGDAYAVPATITSNNINQAFSADDQNVGYISGTTLWQTKNLTSPTPIWTQIATGTSTIRAIATVNAHPNILAYCASNRFYISHNVLDSTPIFTFTNLPFTATVAEIAISSVDTNLIFILLNSSVYKSIDGGLSFTNYTGTLPTTTHLKICLDDFSGNNSLYVGNTLGVYYRNDTMADWINYSGVLPTIASIKDIMYFNDGGNDARIYVSYYGRGTWETKLENFHTCLTPTIIGTSNPGSNVYVLWDSTGATQYEIQYKEVGTLQWNTLISLINGVSITSFVGCTNYEVRVRGLCVGDTSLWSARYYFTTISNPLNSDFDNHADIGTVGVAGSVCYDAANQRYTIFASGDDIWGTNDQFHFLYKKLNGDVTISARVKHIGNIYGWAKGGVMIRETLNTDSKHSMCALTPGNGFANQWRTNTNGNSDNADTSGNEPGWVMLERTGNTFTSYFSTDGISWNVLNSVNINMADTVYVGLGNCSHIDTAINDAVFDNIIINGTALSTQTIVENNLPFIAYPNPANNELSIKFNDELRTKNLKITVVDIMGNKLLYQTKSNTNAILKMNISLLPSGIYFLEIDGARKSATKFVKK